MVLINLGSRVPFTDSFPVCQATRKTVALHSTLLVCCEKRVAVEALLLVMAPFGTEAVLTVLHRNDPPWLRLDSAVNSPPRATRSCALCNNQILERWMNVACACDETRVLRPWSIAKTCSHAVSAHAVDFETKLETSRGVHWQRWPPPPPPVYAPALSRAVVIKIKSLPISATTIPTRCCLCTSRTMGESISTIQRSPRISTSYKFAAPRYRLPPMALQTFRWASNLACQRHWKIPQSCHSPKD